MKNSFRDSCSQKQVKRSKHQLTDLPNVGAAGGQGPRDRNFGVIKLLENHIGHKKKAMSFKFI
jgi:hypothetical protein